MNDAVVDAVGVPILVGARIEYRFKRQKCYGGGIACWPGIVTNVTAKRVVVRLDVSPKNHRVLQGRSLFVVDGAK